MKEAFQLGIDRASADLRGLLPAGYEVDATQRFSPREAAVAARPFAGQRMVGLVTDRFDRLGKLLVDSLQAALRVTMNVEVVPEAQMLDRVKSMMGANAAPDFVLGDEALAARLRGMDYTTDFIRL
jgi:hypothetical protein